MYSLIILVLAMLTAAPLLAQQSKKKPAKTPVHKHTGYGVVEATPPPEVFTYVEQAPEFVGGQAALEKFLADNLHYPDFARENVISGQVFVRFIVDEEGLITNARVITPIGYGCDEEALRVVKAMPRWHPGKINGQRRKTMFILPLKFKIT